MHMYIQPFSFAAHHVEKVHYSFAMNTETWPSSYPALSTTSGQKTVITDMLMLLLTHPGMFKIIITDFPSATRERQNSTM